MLGRCKISLFVLFMLFAAGKAFSQCENFIFYQEIDPFDSTLTISTGSINIGYMVPSEFKIDSTGDYRMIEEGKVLFSFAQNDSIDAFFLTIALAERQYFTIDEGYNVFLKLSNDTVIRVYNVPNRGTFNPNINMRIYNHTCVVPIDLFYTLAFYEIDAIRIVYRGYKRTVMLTEDQKTRVKQAVQCVGESLNIYPIKP